MWCPGDASGVDRERLEGAHTGVREGRPIGSFACLKRSHGHVPRCMGAERVQGERTHRARPAGAKDSILIRCFRPLGLSEHGKILRAQCVRLFLLGSEVLRVAHDFSPEWRIFFILSSGIFFLGREHATAPLLQAHKGLPCSKDSFEYGSPSLRH
jgi:hypothetical protein